MRLKNEECFVGRQLTTVGLVNRKWVQCNRCLDCFMSDQGFQENQKETGFVMLVI